MEQAPCKPNSYRTAIRFPFYCIGLFFILAMSIGAEAADVDLTWDEPQTNDDSTELNDLSHYNVYAGPSTAEGSATWGPPVDSVDAVSANPDPSAAVSRTVTGLLNATEYCFVVTAIDSNGNESVDSNPGNLICGTTASSDSDGDGIEDSIDNCPTVANPSQTNTDGDSEGDACDANDDNDARDDSSDCSPLDNTKWQNGTFYADGDGDTVRDTTSGQTICYGSTTPSGFTSNTNGPDNCVGTPNVSQTNTDGDSEGDACDVNDDNDARNDSTDCSPLDNTKWRNATFYADGDADTVRDNTVAQTICYGSSTPSGFTANTNGPDNCVGTPNTDQVDVDGDGIGDACDDIIDSDGDGVADSVDNCPTVHNPSQLNTDGDSEGDACDANDDNDSEPDISDCADTDATKWRNGTFYADDDADTVRDNTTAQTICYGNYGSKWFYDEFQWTR